jgi:hypothetical protein
MLGADVLENQNAHAGPLDFVTAKVHGHKHTFLTGNRQGRRFFGRIRGPVHLFERCFLPNAQYSASRPSRAGAALAARAAAKHVV